MIDESGWPLVRVQFTDTARDFDEAVARFPAWLDRKTRFGMVLNIAPGLSLDPQQRKRFASLLDTRRGEFSQYLARQGIVMHSAVSRGVVTALSWLTSSPFPMRTFSNTDEAERWVREALQ